MPHYIPRSGSVETTFTSFSSRANSYEEPVTGVPLHFGPLPASYGQHSSAFADEATGAVVMMPHDSHSAAARPILTEVTMLPSSSRGATWGAGQPTAFATNCAAARLKPPPRATATATMPSTLPPVHAQTTTLPVSPAFTQRPSRSAGEVARDVVRFPFQAVGYTVSLPFRALSSAHDTVCRATGVEPSRRCQRRAARRAERRARFFGPNAFRSGDDASAAFQKM